MAMQLGAPSSMFGTPDPGRELQFWQENQRQNQELQMRQQQLQANLASQQLQDQTTQLQNARLSTGNQFDLDSYHSRLEGLTESLTGVKLDNSLKAAEAIYRPDLWRSQLKGAEAQTDLTREHVSALRQSLQMDKQKFELAKRAADQEFAAGEINNAFKSLQMPAMITEQAQKIQMNAAQLKAQTLQNMLAEKQAKGFDMTQTLGRFQAYQMMDPSLRKVAKKYAPEVYGDMPDDLEEDDIKTMNNAIGVLRFLKEDPAMQLMGKSDPAQAQIKQAAMKLLDSTFQKAAKRGKTETSVGLEEAMSRLTKLTKSSIRKNGGGDATNQPPADDADTIDRFMYHRSQHRSEANQNYSENSPSYSDSSSPDVGFVQSSPFGSKVSAQGSQGNDKDSGWFRNSRGVIYQNPSMGEKDSKDFSAAIGHQAPVDGTNAQVTAFRSLINELGDALEGGDREGGKDIIEKYGRLGEDFFTPKQKQALKNLIYKFGWKD